MSKGIRILALSGLLALLTATVAEARHLKVYGVQTLEAGEAELVYWTDYVLKSNLNMNFFNATVSRDKLWSHTLEIEYGLTDRWTVAAYADFEDPDVGSMHYIQTRVVGSRYRLTEPGERFFDGGLYVEYYLPKPAYQADPVNNPAGYPKEKLEARILLEKSIGAYNLRINPKLEKVVSGPDVDEGLEFAYALSLYRPWREHIEVGVELYGDTGEFVNVKPSQQQEHYIVPALTFEIMDGLEWNVGVGIGLTNDSDDTVFKSILEWEL